MRFFLAEIIVNKFPEDLDMAKEILVEKQPLTVEVVLESLDKHKLDADEPKNKVNFVALATRRTPGTINYCSNGTHNENSKHSRAEGYQLHPEKRPPKFKKKDRIYENKPSASSAITLNNECDQNCSSCSNPRALSCCAVGESKAKLLDGACSNHMMSNGDALLPLMR
ncbi:hypothetical protein CROQUDRAFT_701041 [Cronartium quercuum f. sp. fusiforme G11]|uniref:Uncharacterized protein n=1 Tax=Cronartium quercuum f. sp. fusiforme G11 TaxID=708437 RepID=A0A9P6NJH4_9BASI|nr:hypothetical protein CROQUDRAFT_701041 [Cronartium quercuum f. sp. fusiforme G11]